MHNEYLVLEAFTKKCSVWRVPFLWTWHLVVW